MAQIKVEKVRVTPTQANSWLLKNTFNRPPSRKRIAALAREMARGSWVLNGDTIRFSSDGRIIDGQHRLLACVSANVPFDTMVATGLDAEVFNTIDTGRPRTPADTFSVRGEKYYNSLAAALVVVALYDDEKISFSSKVSDRWGATNGDFEAMLEDHPAVRESVAWAVSNRTPLAPVSIISGLHYIFGRINKADRDRFLNSFCHGTNIDEGSPMQRLQGVLLENASSTTKVTRGHMMGMILMAWNAMRTGKKITRMRAIDGVKYPVAV